MIATSMISEFFVGTWKMIPEQNALCVGPGQGDCSWWTNSAADVTGRDCYFDDEYIFDSDGSFSQNMQGDTWLEPWQVGIDTEGCGAPISPHDGSNSAATWSLGSDGTQLTINGEGAFLGVSTCSWNITRKSKFVSVS